MPRPRRCSRSSGGRIFGTGSALIGKSLKTEILREEALELALDGFLPFTERGEAPKKPGTLEINGKSPEIPAVVAAFAGARLHDPLLFEAYQGSDPDGIKGAMAMAKHARNTTPAL